MSTGLSEQVFETIIQKIKVENLELVVDDDVSDLEDIIENNVTRQNTICKKAISSNKCLNNEKESSVAESNSQKPENEKVYVSRRTRNMKTRSNSSSNKILDTISPRTSKTVHKCSELCNWYCSAEKFGQPVHTGQLKIIKKQNATFKKKSTMHHETEKIMDIGSSSNSHNMTPVDEESRMNNIQKSKSPYEQNECLKVRKKKSTCCSVSNCYQDSVHTLSINEDEIMKKIFSEFNFSFIIRPFFFSTFKRRQQKILLAFCDEHLRMINVIKACQLCSNEVEKLDFEDFKMYDHWNLILLRNNIGLKLQPGMFLCLTCKCCIIDDDFLSPVNLKCLRENVEENNNERMKTFGVVNHPSTSIKNSTSMDRKVTFSEPVVTSTFIFKRSIDEINKKKVIENSKSIPNNRVNKIMNLLTNKDLEPEMKNSDTSEPNDEVQMKLGDEEEKINPLEFHYIVDLTIEEESDQGSKHDEKVQLKSDVDLSKFNSFANVTETLTTNDDTVHTDEDLKTIHLRDLMINDQNEEIHQYQIEDEDEEMYQYLIKNEDEEINYYYPNHSEIFSNPSNSSLNKEINLLPIVTNVVSQKDLLVDNRDNIFIDLTDDQSESDDKSDQYICDSFISRESKLRFDLSASNFEPNLIESPLRSFKKKVHNTPSNISNKNIKKSRFKNTLVSNTSVVNSYDNEANIFDSSYDPINDNTAQNDDTNTIPDSDNMYVVNLPGEKNEEGSSMLINMSELQSDGGEAIKRDEELSMSLSHFEKQNILSSDEDKMSTVDKSSKQGLRIKNTFSLNPNGTHHIQFDRKLQKINDFSTTNFLSKPKIRKYSYDNDECNDGSKSETLYDVHSLNSGSIIKQRKTKTLSITNKKMKQFYNESIKALTDKIHDPYDLNSVLLNRLEKQMGGTVKIFKHLMKYQRMLYNGKLIVSENANSEVAEYFKKHLESFKNVEDFCDVDVSMPSLSPSPIRKLNRSSTAPDNYPAVDIIPTSSNSISTSMETIYNNHNLSSRSDNLDMVASKTSMPILSNRILCHSSVDSKKTNITKSNNDLYPQNKYTRNIEVLVRRGPSNSQPRPIINKPRRILLKPRRILSKHRVLVNQTRPIISPRGLNINQPTHISSCQPIMHPSFQLPTAVRSKPFFFVKNNSLDPNCSIQTVKNSLNTTPKYVFLKKPKYLPTQ